MAAAVAPRSYMWYKIFVLRRALERLMEEQGGGEEAYLVWVDADAVIVSAAASRSWGSSCLGHGGSEVGLDAWSDALSLFRSE